MPTDPRFLEAWVNRRDHRVLGRRLHPLCFLDLLALEAVGSPFIDNSAEATPGDFAIAVQILSRPHRALEIDATAPRPGLALALRLRWCDLARENAALQAYFDDYFTALEMWRPETTGKRCQAPWILGVVTFLLQHSRLDEWRVWTAPVGQMLCYANAIEEQAGESQVVSLAELEQMAAAREAPAAA